MGIVLLFRRNGCQSIERKIVYLRWICVLMQNRWARKLEQIAIRRYYHREWSLIRHMCKLSVCMDGWTGESFSLCARVMWYRWSQKTKHVVNEAHHIHIFHVCMLPNDARIMKCQFNYSRRCGDDTLSIRFNSFACHPISGPGFYIFFVQCSHHIVFIHPSIWCHRQKYCLENLSGWENGNKQRSGHTSSSMPNRLRKMLHMLGLGIWFGMDMSKNTSRNRTHSKYSAHVFFLISLPLCELQPPSSSRAHVIEMCTVRLNLSSFFDTKYFCHINYYSRWTFDKCWKSSIWYPSEFRSFCPVSKNKCRIVTICVHYIRTWTYITINLNRYFGGKKAAALKAKDRKRKQKWPIRNNKITLTT